MAADPTVLIVTRRDDDVVTPAVVRAIEMRGGHAVRFDTDDFPGEAELVARLEPGADQLELVTREGRFDLAEVSAIWHRRLAFGGRLPESFEPRMRDACRQEARASAMGLLASLRAFRLDVERELRRAEHKPLQLRVARDVGLEVPATLVTNDAGAVRAFAAERAGGVVTKMLSSFAVFEGGEEKVVFTSALGADDLEHLDGLQWSPMTFQERVPKALELRVIVVGDRVMAAAVNSAAHAGAEVDWRRLGPSLQGFWKPHVLPDSVRDAVLRLMDTFQLNYGALDFILTPGGRYVFLEINPAGEFFWIDAALDGAISGALADVLLGRARRREGAATIR